MTHKTTTRIIQKMGLNFDQPVLNWRDEILSELENNPTKEVETKEVETNTENKKGSDLHYKNIIDQ